MAKTLNLRIYPDPILREKAKSVLKEQLPTEEFRQLILNMEQTMNENEGVGLAAPQIGISRQLCIVKTGDGTLVLINPRIKKLSWKKQTGEEGCLSIPGVFGQVRRHHKISVTTLRGDGKLVTFTAEGMLARIIQHEVDHLNGVLFIDRTKEITEGKDILEKMKEASV